MELETKFSLPDLSLTYKFAVTAVSASGESPKSELYSINFNELVSERKTWCFNSDLLKVVA